MNRQIIPAGLDLIRHAEGCRLDAYQDSVGVWTIGYGHTRGVTEGMSITQDQADAFLVEDAGYAGESVEDLVNVNLTDHQYAALVSLSSTWAAVPSLDRRC
jgi:lysozyme